jgi:hypothetical protein
MNKKEFLQKAVISIAPTFIGNGGQTTPDNVIAEWSIDLARELWHQLEHGAVRETSQNVSVLTVVGSCTYCKHAGVPSTDEPCTSCRMKNPSNWEPQGDESE